MPPKKIEKAKEVQTISRFSLYKNATDQLPNIVVNLIKNDKYNAGIISLREILSTCRDNYKLIEFKVRSSSLQGPENKDRLPIFFMQCSSLYTVGYKKSDGSFRIFIDTGEARFPSLKYPTIDQPRTGDNTNFNFLNIAILDEATRENIEDNLHVVHTVGLIVSEALRYQTIQTYVNTLISNQNYNFNVKHKVFAREFIESVENPSAIQMLQKFSNTVNEIEIHNLFHNWGNDGPYREKIISFIREQLKLSDHVELLINFLTSFIMLYLWTTTLQKGTVETIEDYLLEDSNEDTIQDASETSSEEEKLDEELYAKENGNNLHQILSNFFGKVEIEAISEFVCYFRQLRQYADSATEIASLSQSGATIKSLTKPANETSAVISISPGIYNLAGSEYSKVEDSERFVYSSFDHKPDDDKGGNAVKLNIKRNEDASNKEYIVDTEIISSTVNQFLSWIWILPEWLQERILNSTPVKSFLENSKIEAAIYSTKSLYNQISKLFDNKIGNEDSSESHCSNENKALIKPCAERLIDTTTITESPDINNWIFFTLIIGLSGNLVSQDDFGGPIGFNEKIMIDLF